MESPRQETQDRLRIKKELRRLPEFHRCPTHLPLNHVLELSQTPQYHLAPENNQGAKRKRYLFSVRVHGHRPLHPD